jgi:hypothetical protein
MWELRRLTTLWAFMAWYRDRFTLSHVGHRWGKGKVVPLCGIKKGVEVKLHKFLAFCINWGLVTDFTPQSLYGWSKKELKTAAGKSRYNLHATLLLRMHCLPLLTRPTYLLPVLWSITARQPLKVSRVVRLRDVIKRHCEMRFCSLSQCVFPQSAHRRECCWLWA